MSEIAIGKTSDGRTIALPLQMATKHALITGSTGMGKTVTLQRIAEEFSRAGVPVFAADVKGDMSGMAAKEPNEKAMLRCKGIGYPYRPRSFPVQFWDLFGTHGTPIRTSVQDMGAELMARMLGLNATQAGALAIAFKKSDDEKEWMLTLDDLRWTLDDMLDQREDVCKKYGNITAASITTIQRNIMALEAQGGAELFGEPPFNICDLMRVHSDGLDMGDITGIINLIHADKLMEAPKLYATFLLWLLTELFRVLPEAGDLDRPKMVFFFDEAHLLFRDAAPALVQQIERLVRLVRSKGVGVFMVTQSPMDIPDAVLAQLGTRIQHCLRAYTPKDQRMVRASANAFRQNKKIDIQAAITTLGIGEALVSVLDPEGIPTIVEKVMIIPPSAKIGPVDDIVRRTAITNSEMYAKYRYGLEDMASALNFKNRMRVARGLDSIVFTGNYQEGQYRSYVPNLDPPKGPPRKTRRFYLWQLFKWSSVLAGLYTAYAVYGSI